MIPRFKRPKRKKNTLFKKKVLFLLYKTFMKLRLPLELVHAFNGGFGPIISGTVSKDKNNREGHFEKHTPFYGPPQPPTYSLVHTPETCCLRWLQSNIKECQLWIPFLWNPREDMMQMESTYLSKTSWLRASLLKILDVCISKKTLFLRVWWIT